MRRRGSDTVQRTFQQNKAPQCRGNTPFCLFLVSSTTAAESPFGGEVCHTLQLVIVAAHASPKRTVLELLPVRRLGENDDVEERCGDGEDDKKESVDHSRQKLPLLHQHVLLGTGVGLILLPRQHLQDSLQCLE
ncbi:hypothetical protein E2C01_031078 [Portunus trituberculatus]|uniref:Uncharacterized protein n=1 Tax=Portunus trituberculatus TaxID=210409 RepID=A0A5B7ESM6_PORTR|nr:hypothetical protein [Portunus trituberculatus]